MGASWASHVGGSPESGVFVSGLPGDLAGECVSLGALLTPNEGTNSTALTFNVENFAVTSAVSMGELSDTPLSACCSHESGAVDVDIAIWRSGDQATRLSRSLRRALDSSDVT